MIEGVDYSTARPSPELLLSAGKQFVCRYLAYLPNAKVLTDEERRALHAAGIGIVLNWEQRAADMLSGESRGISHAKEALKQANALGAPETVPIYFSCDVDTTISNRAAVIRYLQGAVSVLGRNRVGVYGEYDLIDTVVPDVVPWGWQTYAWSSGRLSTKAHIYQYRNNYNLGGHAVDLNRAMKTEFGAWMRPRGSADMFVQTSKAVYAIGPNGPIHVTASEWNRLSEPKPPLLVLDSDDKLNEFRPTVGQVTHDAIVSAVKDALRQGTL